VEITPAYDPPPAAVHALLGPTNTGKTYRAIERMLEFERGMLGLPLRLLAREVYDRVSARVGEQAVALVTGEEKRIPARARYFVCTVEAMPRVSVDFLAVDEIQLMAHAERGHVFTDRLLHWRGERETWFLGSDTIKPLVVELLRLSRVERLPRLSQLRDTGQASVRNLPRRSAVIAFSMQQVYALADLLRVRRGGAAVVMGALSPRVRNAQVSMYQAGEVDFLVATDAIGMGLNLDLDHVALAARTKFDGRETRDLDTAELAQIVGRAGRYMRDGTFGTLAPLPPFGPSVVQQLESHRFPAHRSAFYRNANLAFSSLDALRASLTRPPPHPALRSAPEADDLQLLGALSARPEVVERCEGAGAAARIELLWDLCRVPNYEKLIPEHAAERTIPLFAQLVERGQLEPRYLEGQVCRLERYDGDIEHLLARLAAVRTWIYLSHQRGWVPDAMSWQGRTRSIEDKLGDVLHQRLVERFVHSRGSARARGTGASHHPFAKLAELGAAQPVEPTLDEVESIVGADFTAFELATNAELRFDGQRLARLVRGKTLLSPGLKPLLDAFEPGARARIERRLRAQVKDWLAELLEPLQVPAGVQASAALRGLLYQLEQGLGCVARREVGAVLAQLTAADRKWLHSRDIVLGQQTVFATAMLSHERLRIRAALSWAFEGVRVEDPELLRQAVWSLGKQSDRAKLLWLGFVALGRVAVRCDRLEAVLSVFGRQPTAANPEASRERAQALLACSSEQADLVLQALPKLRRRRRRRSAKSGASKAAASGREWFQR
jgi:ATP-dependent RNA helicase SUPV3L1/SUV3